MITKLKNPQLHRTAVDFMLHSTPVLILVVRERTDRQHLHLASSQAHDHPSATNLWTPRTQNGTVNILSPWVMPQRLSFIKRNSRHIKIKLLVHCYRNMFCRFGRRLGSARYSHKTSRERTGLSNITGSIFFFILCRLRRR